jgi:hypothetical protein
MAIALVPFDLLEELHQKLNAMWQFSLFRAFTSFEFRVQPL